MRAISWASELAERLLDESLPQRWEHTKGVAFRAGQIGPLVGDSAGVLQAAAYLHDIGYSPLLVQTGFHPLDGARYLRVLQNVNDRVTRLVANHSFALLEAEERGLHTELASEFPQVDDPLLVDVLVFCDMTTTPSGLPTTPESRLQEITSRYGADSVVGRFIRRAEPEILASVARVRAAADSAGVAL